MESVWKVYKTKQCNSILKNQECSQKEYCTFFHDETDRRRTLNLSYEPILCLDSITSDHCLHETCKFCRNFNEYIYHPQNFKTRECVNRKLGISCTFISCPYFHSPEERYQFQLLRENMTKHNHDNEGYESESESETPLQAKPIAKKETSVPVEVRMPDLKRLPSERGYYVLKEEVKKFEDRHTEFKACSGKVFNPNLAVDLITPYICAFLNTQGGTLFYGIRDDGLVNGVTLTRKLRDQFSTIIDSVLNAFTPHLSADDYQINFANVHGKDGQRINDLYVIEIKVKKGDKNEIYFSNKGEAYIKRDASISLLKGPNLLKFFQKRSNGQVSP
ncbi:unnamed protein product [Blepharisma stoltei]|uniref:Schlafen AlbA-2 domain-containing protein n=1 Tax=Blepharisma stoltei TaxID=1481888 RepID=A0AAU9JG86_9CILI|nr:unnamed protein product [Blepharisma stoltei]